MMKFQKHVKLEVREYLSQQLKEYESETQMSCEERRLLHEWVSNGGSPYENGDYIYGAGGLIDFISAHRAMQEIMARPDNSLTESESCVQHGTEMRGINRFDPPDMVDEDLPLHQIFLGENGGQTDCR